MRLIESAAASSSFAMLAPTLSVGKRKEILKDYQNENQSRLNLAFRTRRMREAYVQANIAALSLPCLLTTTILCTIPDNVCNSRINKKTKIY